MAPQAGGAVHDIKIGGLVNGELLTPPSVPMIWITNDCGGDAQVAAFACRIDGKVVALVSWKEEAFVPVSANADVAAEGAAGAIIATMLPTVTGVAPLGTKLWLSMSMLTNAWVAAPPLDTTRYINADCDSQIRQAKRTRKIRARRFIESD